MIYNRRKVAKKNVKEESKRSIENPEDVEKDDSCYNGDSKNCEESEPSSKTNSQKEMLRLVEEAREREAQRSDFHVGSGEGSITRLQIMRSKM